MAFCNSCGGNLESGAKFCPKCGASVPASAVTASSSALTSPSTPQPQSSSALKVILVVVAVIIGLGILGMGTMAFLVHRAISRTRVENRNGNVRVETPFGTVESTDNPEEAARNLGVEVYPGASTVKGSAANLTIGSMHTVAAELETSDSPEKVAEFYRAKFPNANYTVADQNRYSIVSTDKKNIVTITIEPGNGRTRIHIANVSGKPATGSD